MGSYLFKWEHPAQEVYVTGTFDDWSKSEKLEKVGSHFEKVVHLSKIDESIYYKFVVDDIWTTDHTDPQETDASGNTNNVLKPEFIKKDVSAVADHGSSDIPGAFPETPAGENQSFSVNPIAGSTGFGNPISTRPGEPLPISTKSVNDNVTLDKASYDNAGGSTVPQLPDVITPERERASKGGMFGLDTTSGAGTMIPESGLAMGAGAGFGAAALAAVSSPHISSVGSSSTTAQLAGQVPLEPRGAPHISSVGPTSTTAGLAGDVPLESGRVPEVVEKSQEAAHVSPEASANPEAVQEKSAVEEELQKKVPEAPAAADNSVSGQVAGIAAGVAASATAAAAGAATYISSSKTGQDLKSQIPAAVQGLKSQLPVAAQGKIDELTKSSNGAVSDGIPIAPTVPDTVQESISKAHVTPEAAANPEAIGEKSAVESELLAKVHSEGSSGTPIAPTVPDTVQESISKAHITPEAAANPEAVGEKSAVESELLAKVQPEESVGEPAPTATAATTATAPGATDSSSTGAATTGTTSKASESSNIGAIAAGGFGASAATSAAIAAIAGKSTSPDPVKSTASPSDSLAAPGISQAQSSATNAGKYISPDPIKSTASPSNSLAAPGTSQAQSSATTAENTPGRDTTRATIDSRDVSPMTRGPNDPVAPMVTTGIGSAETKAQSTTAGATSTTPKKTTTPAVATSSSSTAASPSSAKTGESPATDTKKNRKSGFFGRLKDKLEHRKDKN